MTPAARKTTAGRRRTATKAAPPRPAQAGRTSAKKVAKKAAAKAPAKIAKKVAKNVARTVATTIARTAVKRVTKKAAAKTVRAKGRSLHLGLNFIDPVHYDGWDGELLACEHDARAMQAICTANGIKPVVLMTREATRAAVLKQLRRAAKSLKAGDIFVLTYSGHGGQMDDATGEEDDGIDETWCLYDAELIDDELYLELGKFAKGVRVLVLSDSCHSGTMTRATRPVSTGRVRQMPPDVARRVYAKHRDFYNGLQEAVARAITGRRSAEPDMIASALGLSPQTRAIVRGYTPAVILISGCMDNQFSRDGDVNGAFTASLLSVWQNGAFTGNYPTFHAAIMAGLPRDQTPNLFVLGPASKFLAQKPFRR